MSAAIASTVSPPVRPRPASVASSRAAHAAPAHPSRARRVHRARRAAARDLGARRGARSAVAPPPTSESRCGRRAFEYVTVGAGRLALGHRRVDRARRRPARVRHRRDHPAQRPRRRGRRARAAPRASGRSVTSARTESRAPRARRLAWTVTSLDDLPIRDDLRGQHARTAPRRRPCRSRSTSTRTRIPFPKTSRTTSSPASPRRSSTLNRYPDREFTAAARAPRRLPRARARPATSIWAANGSNEVLQHILQAFGGPGRIGARLRADVLDVRAARRRAPAPSGSPPAATHDFELSPETAVAAVREHDPDIVLLCAPNNPTGTPLSLETIEAVADAAARHRRRRRGVLRVRRPGHAERAHPARGRGRACSSRAR